jgi:hypothetical protein
MDPFAIALRKSDGWLLLALGINKAQRSHKPNESQLDQVRA